MNGSWQSTWSWRRLRLLVVDDEPTVRNLIGQWLSIDGHYFETSADGLDGLKRFNAKSWDLVITDRVMPKLDGDGFATAIKEIDARVPVILVTAFADRAPVARGDGRPFDIVISKPLRRDTLRAAIAAFRLRSDD